MKIAPLPPLNQTGKLDPLAGLQDLASYLTINKDRLTEELETHCVKASQIAAASARATSRHERAKQVLDEYEAGQYLNGRQQLAPKMSEKEIESNIIQQDDYKKLKSAVIDVNEQRIYLDKMNGIMSDRMAILINIAKRLQVAEGQVG